MGGCFHEDSWHEWCLYSSGIPGCLLFFSLLKLPFYLRRDKQVFFPLFHWCQQLLQPPEVEALPLPRWTVDVPQVVSKNSGSCEPAAWVFLIPCESGRHSKQQQVSEVRHSFTLPPRGVHNLLLCKTLLQVSIHRATRSQWNLCRLWCEVAEKELCEGEERPSWDVMCLCLCFCGSLSVSETHTQVVVWWCYLVFCIEIRYFILPALSFLIGRIGMTQGQETRNAFSCFLGIIQCYQAWEWSFTSYCRSTGVCLRSHVSV